MVISADEFNRVANAILDECHHAEMKQQQEREYEQKAEEELTPFPLKNDIVRRVTSMHASNDLNQLKRAGKVAQLVIAKLLQEGKLMFVDEEKTRLMIHPNFEFRPKE